MNMQSIKYFEVEGGVIVDQIDTSYQVRLHERNNDTIRLEVVLLQNIESLPFQKLLHKFHDFSFSSGQQSFLKFVQWKFNCLVA